MGGTDLKWKLGFAAGLGWCGWIGFYSHAMTAWLAWLLTEELAKDSEDMSIPFLVEAVIRFLLTIVTGALGIIYVRVSSGTPRPRQLHHHAWVLMLLLPEILCAAMDDQFLAIGKVSGDTALFMAGTIAKALLFVIYGIRRGLFLTLMVQKMAALGTQKHWLLNIRLWGYRAIFCTALVCSSVICLRAWTLGLILRGVPLTELKTFPKSSAVDRVALQVLRYVLIGSVIVNTLACSVFVLISWHLVCKTLRKLRNRNVSGENLEKARRTLWRHFAGVTASLATSNVSLIPSYLIFFGVLEPDLAYALPMSAYSADVLGDIIGIVLLSGIGTLIFREDQDAGDISGHIHAVLHAAVLTSRCESVFEGVVAKVPSNSCIVSFPGQYMADWNALTWLCEQGKLAAATVFLPLSDPAKRFGKHTPCPEFDDGRCWCHAIYGEPKPWGCLWFDVWRENLEKAVELGLDLIVVFYPGQAGQGLVEWSKLGEAELWDGIGLGGSQKSEVAYLHKMGYPNIIEEDIEATRRRISAG